MTGPVGQGVACVVEKPFQDVHPSDRVDDLRVELHAVDAPVGVLHGSNGGVGGRGGRHESVGDLGHGVTVTHPDGLAERQLGEQHALV